MSFCLIFLFNLFSWRLSICPCKFLCASICVCSCMCIYAHVYAVAGVFLYPPSSSCIYAAVCAVVSVNVVIAMFVYVAWNSEPRTARQSTAAAAVDKLD